MLFDQIGLLHEARVNQDADEAKAARARLQTESVHQGACVGLVGDRLGQRVRPAPTGQSLSTLPYLQRKVYFKIYNFYLALQEL